MGTEGESRSIDQWAAEVGLDLWTIIPSPRDVKDIDVTGDARIRLDWVSYMVAQERLAELPELMGSVEPLLMAFLVNSLAERDSWAVRFAQFLSYAVGVESDPS
jgi:hypothetical protein